jgi:hypothetical protein
MQDWKAGPNPVTHGSAAENDIASDVVVKLQVLSLPALQPSELLLREQLALPEQLLSISVSYAAHWQANESGNGVVHTLLCLQGFDRHSSLSCAQFSPLKPGVHEQL